MSISMKQNTSKNYRGVYAIFRHSDTPSKSEILAKPLHPVLNCPLFLRKIHILVVQQDALHSLLVHYNLILHFSVTAQDRIWHFYFSSDVHAHGTITSNA